METWQALAALIGRILLVVIFLNSGIGKIGNFSGTVQSMIRHGVPFADLALTGAIFCEVVGSIAIMLGYFTRFGAVLLLLFLVPTTYFFHTDFADPMQKIQFMKNLSIFGGLLVLLVMGPGRFSLDHVLHKAPKPAVGDQ